MIDKRYSEPLNVHLYNPHTYVVMVSNGTALLYRVGPMHYGHLGDQSFSVLIIKVSSLSRSPDYQGALIIKVS